MRPVYALLILLITFLTLAVSSCNLITEPERIINENVKPIEIRTLDFQGLNPGQHVDGIIYFEINTDSIDFEITEISLYVDNEYAGYAFRKPYILELNTRNFDEGLHQISIRINGKDKSHGMLNLLYPPNVVLVNELYFDRTPPQAVALSVSKSEDGKTAILNWTESTNENFAAYRIHRSYKHNAWDLIHTIYSKDQTSFADSSIEKISGLEVVYMVEACTNLDFNYYQYRSFSNQDTTFYGKILKYPLFEFTFRDIIINNNRQEIYFTTKNTLIVFSTADHKLKREVQLNDLVYQHPLARIILSDNASRLLIFNPHHNKIIYIDPATYAIEKILTLPFSPSLIQAEAGMIQLDINKLLIITTDRMIRIIDIESGEVTDSTSAFTSTEFYSFAVNPEKTRLMISMPGSAQYTYKVAAIDLTSDGLPLINEKNSTGNYIKLGFSPDGSKIFGMTGIGGGIHIIDFNSLEYIGDIVSTTILNFYIYDNRIYLRANAHIILPGGESLFGHEIARYNINNLIKEESWVMASTWPSEFVVSPDHIYQRSSIHNSIAIAIPLEY